MTLDQALLQTVKNSLFLWSPIGVIIAPFIYLWSQLDVVGGLFAAPVEWIVSATTAVTVSGIGGYLGAVNRFAPVSEAFVMLSIYLGLTITCSAIRMVKAWIPTVA